MLAKPLILAEFLGVTFLDLVLSRLGVFVDYFLTICFDMALLLLDTKAIFEFLEITDLAGLSPRLSLFLNFLVETFGSVGVHFAVDYELIDLALGLSKLL